MMLWILLGILCAFTSAVISNPYRVRPGPLVNATRGEPWPRPYQTIKYDGFLVLRPSVFQILVTGETCDILEDAIQRYTAIVTLEASVASKELGTAPRAHARQHPSFAGSLASLNVRLINPCEHMPHLNMNESYVLDIRNTTEAGSLVATSIWGILRGLETFTQLLSRSGHGPNFPAEILFDMAKRNSIGLQLLVNNLQLALKPQTIVDKPRLQHRGLLLDTSRHYLPISDILGTLDAMSYNKMNVFHWHITDDQSFPYQSTRFPELSAKGAFHPTLTYTPENVQKIIEYARYRGIRVIPEFDTPGHTRSWGESHPDLLTPCYDDSTGAPDGTLGPLDPTESKLYPFLRELFAEISVTFPERYIHLGGDEVPFDCWASNPRIREYMQQHHYNGRYEELEAEYIQNLLNITRDLSATSIVWQEVFDNGVQLSPDTVVHVWTGNHKSKLAAVTKAGFHVLLSACWYLDHLANGGDWRKFYACDPLAFPSTIQQRELMMGGEACMWGEVVDSTNVHPRIWPRASATAERLWSHEQNPSVSYAAQRLEEHACRMSRRGIPAQPPNGPGFCIH